MGISSRRMRGIGFEVEEMMKLFLVIIIGLGIVILIIAASGGISSLLNDFCAKNPSICGASVTQRQLETAKASVEGLAKAINCVENEDQACLSPNVKKMGFTGLATSEPSGSTAVECKKDSKGYVCTVNNFQLPQEITDAQKWILGMGDPNFIVYYQSFPKEETDAWQISKSNFVALSIIGSGLLNAAFGGFGSIAKKAVTFGGKIVKDTALNVFDRVAAKMGKTATEDTLVIAAEKKLAAEIDEQIFAKTVRDVFEKLPTTAERDSMVKVLVNEYYRAYETVPDKAVVTEKMITFVKNNPNDKLAWSVDYLDKLSEENKGTLRTIYESFKDKLDAAGITIALPDKYTALRYGIVLTTAFLAARADSIDEKFNSIGNSLGLRSPYNVTMPFELSKPVYVELKKGITQYDTRFYLASPCNAKLTVKKGTTTCWHSDASGSCQPGPATVKIGDNDVTVCEKSAWWCNFKSLFSDPKIDNTEIDSAYVLSDGRAAVLDQYDQVISRWDGTKWVQDPEVYIATDSTGQQFTLYTGHKSTCPVTQPQPEDIGACHNTVETGSEQKIVEDYLNGMAFLSPQEDNQNNNTELIKYSFSEPSRDEEMQKFQNDMETISFAAAGSSTDAILISAEPLPGGGSEYSPNYCYWGPNTGAKAIKYSALATAVLIDVFGTAATGGVGAYVILGATGAGSAYVEHVADSKSMWPSGGIGG